MNHTFVNEKGHLNATVIFNEEEIKKASNKAIRALCENVTVPGFRKGKAPVETASRYLRSNQISEETIDQLLHRIDSEFSKSEDFNAYIKGNLLLQGFRPQVNITKFSNTEAEFHITYILRPEVSKLGNYKDLKATAELKAITEEDVEKELNRLAQNEAELAPKDKDAEKGDTVNIDFVGLMNGKEFDGGKANSFDLELGSNHFVPGFEDACVGHKAGDKFDIALTMPENYPEPLKSKPVVFKVTLNAVKVKEIPAIDDDFATTLSGQYASKDLADLKEKVHHNLEHSALHTYENALVNELLSQVRDASEFVIADEYLDRLVEDRVAQDSKNIEQQGLSLKEYLDLIKKDEESYKAEIRVGILGELKNSLVYDAFAKAENIPAPTRQDIEARLHSPISDFINNFTNYLKSSKMPEDQIQNQINNYINQIFSSIMSERVQHRILEVNGFKPHEEEHHEEAKAEEEAPVAEETASTEEAPIAEEPASEATDETKASE